MKVVILCGGLGSRLREETVIKPKPMVEIAGFPILWHIMKYYSHFGHQEFILCLGYKGEIIKEYFYHYEILNNDFSVHLGQPDQKLEIYNNHSEDGWKVTLSNTGINTLKGARIKKIEKYIGQDDLFLLTYGDGVANIDLNKLIEFHQSHGKMATVTGVRPPSRFGELLIKDQQVIQFSEKPQVSAAGLINGGFFVINRSFFNYLSLDENCDLEKGPLEILASQGELMVFEHEGEWECMDTLRDVENLNKLWKAGKAFWKVWE